MIAGIFILANTKYIGMYFMSMSRVLNPGVHGS